MKSLHYIEKLGETKAKELFSELVAYCVCLSSEFFNVASCVQVSYSFLAKSKLLKHFKCLVKWFSFFFQTN